MISRAADAPLMLLLAQLVESRCGLHYAERDLDLFAERTTTRAHDAGFEQLLDYYYLLRYDDPARIELDQLIEALVVGETYFFRERTPLKAIVETIAPVARARGARVWSAACATGEEPVTLAILLEQAGLRDSVEIVASDLSERALDRARRGEYTLRAHRALPAEGMPPWIRVRDNRPIVEERIRTSIDWRRVNLTDAASVLALGTFDAILCRNVLIYFSDETVRTVATNLARALAPDGRLLVGASESLLRFGTTFECEERGGAFLYKRGGGR